MSGVPEKARFFLERAVPQLREFESKGIFTSAEIRNLVRKRTDFEHLVLSPGNTPSDWLNYASWEKSLETLRAKRCKRLQIKQSTSHSGTGRIFSILERAVNRHPADVGLWKEYLDYANSLKATKRYRKIMTRALRMHPAKPDLWVMAGRRAASNSDMQGARTFFMRGTRFCAKDAVVWVEYARCEMEWLQRMEQRKGKKGGQVKAIMEQKEQTDDFMEFEEEDEESDGEGGDGMQVIIPDADRSAGNKRKGGIDPAMEEKMKSNPALDGAIPMAIFDISRKQGFFKPATAEQFFFVFAGFTEVACQGRILEHVLGVMTEAYPNDPATAYCYVQQPLIGAEPNSPNYPKALREALSRLKTSFSTCSNKGQLMQKVTAWFEPILAIEDLDAGIRTVLEHTLRTLPKP